MSLRAQRRPKTVRGGTGGDLIPPGPPSKLADLQGLFVVATPIGNLGDFSTRAREILSAVDVIACEDSRVSAVLLSRNGIATPTTPYHDHNAESVRPGLVRRLANGESIALISDAGTPLISDPGFKLVRACVDAGIKVTPVPGASAVMTALMVAGLATDRFMFAGFLPTKPGARDKALLALKAVQATLVFFESPVRTAESLAAMAAIFGVRAAAVCRELTKLHEEVRRGDLAELAATAAVDPPRGEVVIVVAGAPDVEPASDAEVERELKLALAAQSLRDAVDSVAHISGRARRDIYALALTLARTRTDGR